MWPPSQEAVLQQKKTGKEGKTKKSRDREMEGKEKQTLKIITVVTEIY